MKTILVPLDGSALAERALPYVRMLAPDSGAKIDMLRVIPTEIKEDVLRNNLSLLHEAGTSPDAPQWLREMRLGDLLRYHAEGYLERLAISLRTGQRDVATLVQIGAPSKTIAAVAKQVHADLIAIATHGYRGLKRWARGSVTDDVLHTTTTPILVIPDSAIPAPVPCLRRILLALDGSAFSRQALPLAAELATQARAELILFRAVAPPTASTIGAWLAADGEETPRAHAFNQLRALADELRPSGIQLRTVVVAGDAAEEIVAAVARHQVDLIVMATHGYSGIKRWALGSVADQVLHTTPTPLLLVRARHSGAAGVLG
jgi:nucleotide-binding universal stress UspA family protein